MKRYSVINAARTNGNRGLSAPLPIEDAAARLYAASQQAVLIVDLTTLAIVEVNSAAATLLDRSRRELLGSSFLAAFSPGGSVEIRSGLQNLNSTGSRRSVASCSARDGESLRLKLSLVRSGSDSYALIHIVAIGSDATASLDKVPGASTLELLDATCEGFVVTDLGLRVDYANRAFTAMTGKQFPDELRGDSLARWLDFSQRDVTALMAQLSQRQAVQVFNTSLRRPALALRQVQISAIAVPEGRDACWGFRIRDLQRHDGAFSPSIRIQTEQSP